MPEARTNPYAGLAEDTDAALEVGARDRAAFFAICTLLSGGTADDDLLASRPLFPVPVDMEAAR